MAKVVQANYAAKLKAAILNAAITGKLTGGTSGWKTVKLGEVCDYGKCTSIQSSEIEDNVWSLDLEDIEKDSGKLLLRVRFGERRAKGTRHVFKKGQLLYSKLRTYLNKVLVADEDGVCTTEIIPLDFGGKVLPDYARIVLMSQMVLDYTATCCYGVKMPRLGTHDGRNIPFPLTPLAIQREIVGKVEELMGFVEVVQEGGAKIRGLGEKARAKILDLAIHGALVAQDLAEPPAAVAASVTTPPYALPPNWKWVKLGEVCDYGKCTSIQSSEIEDNVWSLDLEDIEKDSGKLLVKVRFGERRAKGTRHIFKKGQLLYSKLRTYLNKVLVADEDGVCTTEILPLDFTKEVMPAYARLVLMSQMALDYTANCGYGVKMPRLGTHDGKRMPIPLPPLAEQKRIVRKVEAMMAALEGLGAGF